MRYEGWDVLVTPELAQEWLAKNSPNNREIDDRLILRYAYDMRHGLWRPSFNPILFDLKGELESGQHRLTALIWAEVSIKMLEMHRKRS